MLDCNLGSNVSICKVEARARRGEDQMGLGLTPDPQKAPDK